MTELSPNADKCQSLGIDHAVCYILLDFNKSSSNIFNSVNIKINDKH